MAGYGSIYIINLHIVRPRLDLGFRGHALLTDATFSTATDQFHVHIVTVEYSNLPRMNVGEAHLCASFTFPSQF